MYIKEVIFLITSTHLIISNIMYSRLMKRNDFKLNRFYFMLGCIKPDFKNDEIKLPHYLENSIGKLSVYTASLMDKNISIKQMSLGLGVVCHFLCDYFCLYHDEQHKNRSDIEHYLYEIALHLRFLMLLVYGAIKINIDNGITSDNVEKIIRTINNSYVKEKDSFKKDINYAIYAASTVLSGVINTCSIVNDDAADNEYEVFTEIAS